MSVRFPLACLATAMLLAALSTRVVAQSPATATNLQDADVALEFRIITVPESLTERVGVDFGINVKTVGADGFERIGVDFNKLTPNGEQAQPEGLAQKILGLLTDWKKTVQLDDIQAFHFMEAIQADWRTSVMQAPKLTVANGQKSTLCAQEQQFFVTGVEVVELFGQMAFIPKNQPISTGLRLDVQPLVSADGRTVDLSLKGNLTELDKLVPMSPITTQLIPLDGGTPAPFTQYIQRPKVNTLLDVDQTLHLPDGGTVLLSGCKVHREERGEFDPPVLSKIPYINRLFKNVGCVRETEHVLLMVTARVMVPEEDACQTEATCPYLKQKGAKTTPDAAIAPETTVLDNLAKLEEARKQLRQAEQHRKKGETELARQAYQKVKELCPGSNLGHLAAARLNHLHARATPKITEGAAEEQEAPRATKAKLKRAAASPEKKVSSLVEQYQQACTEGRMGDAKKLAARALAIDPACFSSAAVIKRIGEALDSTPELEPFDYQQDWFSSFQLRVPNGRTR